MKSRSRHQFNVRRVLGILFLCSLTLCLWLGQFDQIVTAQSPDAPQLVQQGIERYKAGDFRGAITPWQTALNVYQKSQNRANVAIVSENLARAYQQLGESEEALSHWDKVIAYYHASKDWKQMGRMLTEAAQAYSDFGQPGKAIALLCSNEKPKPKEKRVCRQGSALQIALEQKDKSGEVAALGSLGEAYRLSGDYEQAIKDLEQAKEIKDPAYQFSVLNSLGNAHFSKGQLESLHANSALQLGIRKANEFQQNARKNYESALQYFQSSLQLAREQDNKPGQMQALLNVIRLDSLEQVDRGKNYSTAAGGTNESYASVKPVALPQSEAIIQEALVLLDKLPNSRNKIYAAIDLANLPVNSVNITSPLTQCFATQRRLPDSQAQELLQQAVKTAQNLQDARSESFALGALGHFYECRQEDKQALELTRKALLAADQKLNAKDSVYLWEWQAGRILQAQQGKESEALSAYERAFTTLEKIRSDILIAGRDLQFDFRDIIRPLYRKFAQLRLEQAAPPSIDTKKRNKELKETLKTIDSLKLAELQNFFGNDCILTAINDKRVDELLGKDTAVISSIILERGVAILLSLPNNETKFEWIKENTGAIIEPETFIKEIAEFREGLVHGRPAINYDTRLAGKLYDWIIRPFEKKGLNPEQIKRLVFIQDGILRTVPMAALYDSTFKEFLVEKYAIATSPSLSLTAPKKLNRQENRALILGLTKEAEVDKQTYSALMNVPSEIKAVQSEFPNSKPLIDEAFNLESVKKELNKKVYPIIHIATHAEFGTIPDDTFIVTGNNNKLSINDLEKVLRQVNGESGSVELLALTACETALGDERAALGLAGVAVQAGVRSTLASLWSVSDESTSNLITEFYTSLRSGMSKAEALRAAQIKLINAKKTPEINHKYDNPAYWAPFIIIGNWL